MAARHQVFRGVPGFVLRPPTREVPALDIDFANNQAWLKGLGKRSISDVLSISRASSKYAQNSAGGLQLFGSGILAITDLGLLVEEARTNLILQSQTLDSGTWAKTSGSITADQIAAPDGTTTADLFTENTSTNFHGPNQSIGLASGTVCSCTVYAKKGTRNYICINWQGIGPAYVSAVYDLSLGVVGETAFAGTGASFVSTSITSLANGWYRCTLVGSAGANPTLLLCTAPAATGNSFSASGEISFLGTAATVYYWGAQVEAGSFATSYIPTTTASATRAADVVTIPTASFSFSATAGCVIAQASAVFLNSENSIYDFGADTNNVLYAGIHNRGLYVNVAGVNVADLSPNAAATANNTAKYGAAWAVNDFSAVYNGSAAVTDSSGALPTFNANVQIGRQAPGNKYLDGNLLRFTYFNSRVSDASMRTLTT